MGAETLWELPEGTDHRGFTSWCDEGLDELAVVTRSPSGNHVLHCKPHQVTAGHALTGLMVVRRSAFERFVFTPTAVGEYDVLQFVDAAALSSSVEFVPVSGGWLDATSSGEALWRAGHLVRAARGPEPAARAGQPGSRADRRRVTQ
jgi:hypothetical protein